MHDVRWAGCAARWVGFAGLLLAGCSQSNERGDAGAAEDARGVIDANADTRVDAGASDAGTASDAASITAASFCIGLDPLSQACAREVVARIDVDACADQQACSDTPLDPAYCAAYYPPEGGWNTAGNRHVLVLVRLGVLRVDLEAAACMVRANRACPTEVVRCGPLFVPTSEPRAGQACRRAEECGEDMVCATPPGSGTGLCDVGVCTPRLALGAVCPPAGGPPCAWNEQCVEGRCRALQAYVYDQPEGARCGSFIAPEGLQYIYCSIDTYCADLPTPTCQRRGSLGESCNGACVGGLRCESGSCVPAPPIVRAGDPCTGGGLCGWATFSLMCNGGVCERSARRIGDRCSQGWAPCVEGFCAYEEDASGSGEDRCRATRLPIGASCGAIDQCESGVCCRGVCTAL